MWEKARVIILTAQDSTKTDFESVGRYLWQEVHQLSSHETASQFIAKYLFEEFCNEEGDPPLSLGRIFRLTHVNDQPGSVRVDPNKQYVMALTGTYGIEEDWCDRSQSNGHQAVPLSQIAVPERIPMFQELLGQLGVDMDHLYETGEIAGATAAKGIGFIPCVPDSLIIPAQDEFVKPYGIQSLLTLGGFMSGNGANNQSLYLLYVFSREPISDEALDKVIGLPEFIGSSVVGTANREVFNH